MQRNCKIYICIYIYRLVELVESSGATSAIYSLLVAAQRRRTTTTTTRRFSSTNTTQAKPVTREGYLRLWFNATLDVAAAAEGKEREGKGSGEKIEKENRPPQRSAGYITKRVVYETSNRFLLPLRINFVKRIRWISKNLSSKNDVTKFDER